MFHLTYAILKVTEMSKFSTTLTYSSQMAIIHFRKVDISSFPKMYGELRSFFGNGQPT